MRQYLKETVRKLFRFTCVRCGRLSGIVHELVPRSKRPKDWWKDIRNGVVVCPLCHEWVHQGTESRRPRLEGMAATLRAVYGGEHE